MNEDKPKALPVKTIRHPRRSRDEIETYSTCVSRENFRTPLKEEVFEFSLSQYNTGSCSIRDARDMEDVDTRTFFVLISVSPSMFVVVM